MLIPCIILYEHSCLHLFHCMWLRCIKSCTKYLSHGFFANRWLIHNWITGLGNPLEVVVHHLIIGGMVSLGYQDEFPMVSALVCMLTHWTGPTVSHDWRLLSSHGLTKLLHCAVSQLWENIKFVLKLLMALIYKWDCQLIIYFLWNRSLLMEVGSNRYLNIGIMISHGFETMCLLGWS